MQTISMCFRFKFVAFFEFLYTILPNKQFGMIKVVDVNDRPPIVISSVLAFEIRLASVAVAWDNGVLGPYTSLVSTFLL